MPRDAVAHTALASGAATATPAGVAINTANGANIASLKDGSRVAVRVTNTAAAAKKVIFRAGVNPPALRTGLGDLTIEVPLTTGDVLVVLESARFAQTDGSINVDYEAGHTGAISAVRLPKGA
jgi:hypothetical protein